MTLDFHCAVCYGRECEDVLVSDKHDVLGQVVIIANTPARMCADCGELWFAPYTDEPNERFWALRDSIIAAYKRKGLDPDAYEPRPAEIKIHGHSDWEVPDEYGIYNEDEVFIPTPPEIMAKIEALRAKNRALASAAD